MPRGRPNPLRQVPNGGCVHSVPRLEVLEQDRTELDQAQGRLAPDDDGVHAGTVAVVGADAAVAVAVEGCCVTARSAITLAGDEIDERCFLSLLHWLPSCVLGHGVDGDRSDRWRLGQDPISAGFWHSIRGQTPCAKREIPVKTLLAAFFRAPVGGRCGMSVVSPPRGRSR